MRVPNDKAPLVSVGTGGTAAGAARQYNTNLGAPMQPGTNAVGAFNRGFSDLKPITDGLQQVARAGSEIIQRSVQEQAETEALEAYAKAGGDLNSFLHGEGGIYSRKGVDAYNSVADTATFFDSTGERYTKGMTTDAARKIFSERFAQLRYGTQSEVSKYEGGQRREALFNQRTAAMALDTEIAMSNPYNDRIFNESLGRVRQDAQAQARMNGMTPEEEQLYLQKVDSQFLAGRAGKFIEAKDYNAAWAILNDSRVSAADKTKLTAAYNESVVAEAQATAKADPQAAAQLLALSRERLAGMPGKGAERGNDPASFTAQRESGGDPAIIGYDKNGGTSYGAFQISSKQGTMDSFLEWLEKKGAKDVAASLRAAGPADTGGKEGGFVEEWKRQVTAGKITYEMQEQFVQETHVDTVINSLPAEAHAAIQDDPMLMNAIYSTAVQHGPNGAKRLVTEAWEKSAGIPGEFIEILYEDRKKDFPSSTKAVQGAVAKRLDAEKAALLGGGRASSPSPDDPYSSLGKPQWVAIQTTAEAALKEHQRLADAARVETEYEGLRKLLGSLENVTPEERDIIAANHIERIEDTDVRQKMKTRFTADRAVDEMRRKANDMQLGREFDKTAQAQGWSPGEALDKIELVEGMSEEGRERWRKKYSGQLKQTTPENRRAADALMVAIDKKEITTQPELDAFVLKHGLTEKQATSAENSLNSGGNKEALRHSMVKSVYKNLVGRELQNSQEFFELVQEALPPGKAPDEAVVRKTISNMLMTGERESSNWGSFGYGRDMTYAEALKEGPDVAAAWLPDISDTERREITASLKKAGFQGKITEQRIREEKRRQMGLPPLAKKEER